jgi:hypothetical protein
MNDILSVAGITAVIVSLVTLVFQYFPGLRVKWAGLKSEYKRGIVLGLYVIVGAVAAFGGCVAFLASIFPNLLCSDAITFLQYVVGVLFAVGAGQGVFELLPELKDVAVAKAERL